MPNDTKDFVCRVGLPTCEYPNRIDMFINPLPDDFQSAPDHAAQHRKANDAIFALENIVGVGGALEDRFVDITGDAMSGSLSIDGTLIIDVTNTEALLIRKDSDGGDVFIVDTTNSRIGIGGAATSGKLEVILANADLAGYYMRHTADNPTSHDSGFFDIQRTLTGTATVATDVKGAGGFVNVIKDQRNADLSTGFALATNQPFINRVEITGSIIGTPQIFQQANLALTNTVNISGVHTVEPQFDEFRVDTFGAFSSISDDSFYTPTGTTHGATFTINAFRGNIGYGSAGGQVNGDLTRINQVLWTFIGGTERGSTTYNYGIYNEAIIGGTENWFIYNYGDNDNYMNGDNSSSFFGTGKDGSLGHSGSIFQLRSDEITSTDSLLLRGGTDGIAFNIEGNEDMILTSNLLTLNFGTDLIIGGDTFWVGDGTGLLYGEIYADDNTTETVLAQQDTWYDVTIFDANGLSNLTTADYTDNSIKIIKAGVYKVDITLDVRSAAANAYYFAAFKNKVAGTELHNLERRRTTTVADKPGALNMSGLVDFAVDDTISLGVQRKDGGGVSKSIIIEHANITITMFGGT